MTTGLPRGQVSSDMRKEGAQKNDIQGNIVFSRQQSFISRVYQLQIQFDLEKRYAILNYTPTHCWQRLYNICNCEVKLAETIGTSETPVLEKAIFNLFLNCA